MSFHPDYDTVWKDGMYAVLEEVIAERHRQVRRYGLNRDLCDGTGPETRWLLAITGADADEIEKQLREDYEHYSEETGAPTWLHLIREEIAEAFKERDSTRLQEELVQVAALCVSWVERLQERGSKPCLPQPGPRYGGHTGKCDALFGGPNCTCDKDLYLRTL